MKPFLGFRESHSTRDVPKKKHKTLIRYLLPENYKWLHSWRNGIIFYVITIFSAGYQCSKALGKNYCEVPVKSSHSHNKTIVLLNRYLAECRLRDSKEIKVGDCEIGAVCKKLQQTLPRTVQLLLGSDW